MRYLKMVIIAFKCAIISVKLYAPATTPKIPIPEHPVVTVAKIAAAIKQKESGGNYYVWGGSGEYGAYQIRISTWRMWSKEMFGEVVAMTPKNQETIAFNKIFEWYKEGLTPEQIAAKWNSNDTVWIGKRGTNKYGVRYDVEKYVKDFNRLFAKL